MSCESIEFKEESDGLGKEAAPHSLHPGTDTLVVSPRWQQGDQAVGGVGGILNDTCRSPHASLLVYCRSAREGSEVPIILLAVLTVLSSFFLSATVQFPYQEGRQ